MISGEFDLPDTAATVTARPESPVVLIAGAAAGIGLAVARHLVGRAHRIIALDIDAAALSAAYAGVDEDVVLQLVADLGITRRP